MATPTGPQIDLRASAEALEALTGRRAFVLVRPFDHLMNDQIEAEIARVLGDDPSGVDLDVVLDSDGGSADAAYKSILILREVSASIRVLVPAWAKSAATLFSLGADGIAMRPAVSELGPLDAQVIDPRNPALTMSALDGYQSVEYLRDYALQTQDLVVTQIMAGTQARIPLNEILGLAEEFSVDVISPIMSRVKPLDFGGWGRTLDIGKAYAERLLARHGMAGAPTSAVRKTADQLVYGYPHHGYVIGAAEALELGLNIQQMDKALYEAAREVVQAAMSCRVTVCDDGGHRDVGGYCGFAPGEKAAAKPAAKATTKRTRKETQTDGSAAKTNGKPKRAASKRS